MDLGSIPCGGIGCGNRANAKRDESLPGWAVSVGTTPSAGGARAPIADILSHIGAEVRRL